MRRSDAPAGEPLFPLERVASPRRPAVWRAWAALRRGSGTLKFRIAASGVLALALGIGLSTGLLLQRAERDTLLAVQADELSDALRSARVLSTRVREAQQALALAGAQLQEQQLDEPGALRAFLESKPVLRGQFDSVFIADPQGHLRMLWDAKGYQVPAVVVADRAYFRNAMEMGLPAVSELLTGRVNNQPLVILAQPLAKQGKRYAVLAGSLMLKRRDLARALTDAEVDASEGRVVVVTDAAGHILAHPDTNRIGEPMAAQPTLQPALTRWQQMGQPLEPSGLNLDAGADLVSAAAVPGADWMVWHWRARDSVMAPLRAGRHQALLAAGLLLLPMGGALLGLLWWQLRPLSHLQRRAAHLFDGSPGVHDDWPQAGGEVGDLARVLRRVSEERVRLEQVKGQILQQLQSVLAAAPVGIAFTRDGRFEVVSAELCRLLGRDEADLLSQPTQVIYASNEDYLALGPKVALAFGAGRAFDGEMPFLRGDGTCFPGRLRGLPVDAANRDAGTIWTLSDITAEVASREALEWAALHDPLTGLANRKAFAQRVGMLFEALPRSRPAALLLLDLDRFKPINDTHGHAAGDAVLRAVANAVQGCIRGGDLAVRLGGDEFAVVLERCPADVALRVAEDMRRAVAALQLPWGSHALTVGVSVGLAPLNEETASTDSWVAAADRACYEAKAAGRDRVQHAGGLRLAGGSAVQAALKAQVAAGEPV